MRERATQQKTQGRIRAVNVAPRLRISRHAILSDPPAFVTEAVKYEARREENRRRAYARMAEEAERSELWDIIAQSGLDADTVGRAVEPDRKRPLTGSAKDELIEDVRGFAGFRR